MSHAEMFRPALITITVFRPIYNLGACASLAHAALAEQHRGHWLLGLGHPFSFDKQALQALHILGQIMIMIVLSSLLSAFARLSQHSLHFLNTRRSGIWGHDTRPLPQRGGPPIKGRLDRHHHCRLITALYPRSQRPLSRRNTLSFTSIIAGRPSFISTLISFNYHGHREARCCWFMF